MSCLHAPFFPLGLRDRNVWRVGVFKSRVLKIGLYGRVPVSGKLLAVHGGAASKGSRTGRICEAGLFFSKRGHWIHRHFSFSRPAAGCCAACPCSRRGPRIRSKVLRAVRVVQPSEVEWRHIDWRPYVDESCVNEGRVRDRTAVGRSATGGRRQGSMLVTATALSISDSPGTEQADKEFPVTIISGINKKLNCTSAAEFGGIWYLNRTIYTSRRESRS